METKTCRFERVIAFVSFVGGRVPNENTFECLGIQFGMVEVVVVNIHSAAKSSWRKRVKKASIWVERAKDS